MIETEIELMTEINSEWKPLMWSLELNDKCRKDFQITVEADSI